MLELTIDSEAVLENLASKPGLLIEAIINKMNALDFMLQAKIAGEKLQGQVLKSHTGTLARSVEAIPAKLEGGSVVGSVQAAGGPAFYGIFHNKGTNASYVIEPIKAKALAFMMGGKQVFAKSVNHPPIQQRNFMESTQQEQAEAFYAGLQEAANEVLTA